MNLKIKVLPHVPFSIHYGGFEISCSDFYSAAKNKSLDISYLQWDSLLENYDILHLFGASPNWFDIATNINPKTKLVVTGLAAASDDGLFLPKIKDYFIKNLNLFTKTRTVHDRTAILCRRIDMLICLNDFERNFFINRYGIDNNKIKVIPNGLHNRWFEKPNLNSDTLPFHSKDYILYVGSICKRKNPISLVKACIHAGLNVVFVGAPDHSDPQYFNDFLKLINQRNNIIYLGSIDSQSNFLINLFFNASCLCLPSYFETQPLVAMQSLALGTPVVLANRPYSFISPFNNVVRCNPNSYKNIADSLFAVRNSNIAKLDISYRIDNIVSRYISIYNSLK